MTIRRLFFEVATMIRLFSRRCLAWIRCTLRFKCIRRLLIEASLRPTEALALARLIRLLNRLVWRITRLYSSLFP